jgi:hypothetical protein
MAVSPFLPSDAVVIAILFVPLRMLGRNLHAIQPQSDPFRNNGRRERGFLSLQALGYWGDHLVRKSPRDSDKRALGRSERERESSWTFRKVRRFRHGLIRSARLTRVYQSPMARPTGSADRDAETMRLYGRQPPIEHDCDDAPQMETAFRHWAW